MNASVLQLLCATAQEHRGRPSPFPLLCTFGCPERIGSILLFLVVIIVVIPTLRLAVIGWRGFLLLNVDLDLSNLRVEVSSALLHEKLLDRLDHVRRILEAVAGRDDGRLGQERGRRFRRGVIRISLDLLVDFEDHGMIGIQLQRLGRRHRHILTLGCVCLLHLRGVPELRRDKRDRRFTKRCVRRTSWMLSHFVGLSVDSALMKSTHHLVVVSYIFFRSSKRSLSSPRSPRLASPFWIEMSL